MLRLEDVVTLTPPVTDIDVIVGTAEFLSLSGQRALKPFDGRVCAFLWEVSRCLFADREAMEHPDIATFAFFCRRANIRHLERRYEGPTRDSLGKGVSFHITPSNVPINFAYSLAMGLLAGNACIVRVSSKEFVQIDIVCRTLYAVLVSEGFAPLMNYVSIVRYGHDSAVTEFFSSICDVRVIWGGDATLEQVRLARLPPRATDITFADRVSCCLIEAETYLGIENKEKVAQQFYNDTYLYDQNACSSPSFVYWLGSASVVVEAKSSFWNYLQRVIVGKGYELEPIAAVEKLLASCRAAIDLSGTSVAHSDDNLLCRVELKSVPSDLEQRKCAGGFYFEYSSDRIDDMFAAMTKKFQTLTYIGGDANELREVIRDAGVRGIDRIVKCGSAMEFDPVWDGVDLVRQMSRIISIG
jgi:hypothetical protein